MSSASWTLRVVGGAGFGVLGWKLGGLLSQVSSPSNREEFLPWGLALSLSGVPLGAVVTPYIVGIPLLRGIDRLNRVPTPILMSGIIGMFIGLVLASLISVPLYTLAGWYSWGLPLSITFSLGLIGLMLGLERETHIHYRLPSANATEGQGTLPGRRILVDTSAIIDGRIADLMGTRFVEGTLVVPRFVLDELRHVADSADPLRRARGRRGLEILGKLRADSSVSVEVLNQDLGDGSEVDAMLVKLAQREKAFILTTDFNLNRVAELQGVLVLNVNELANALKPIVLPGEDLSVSIVQEGKETGQGVGYLDDGTMVVVEGGKRYINSNRNVTVTRVLQTGAGRLIFAQPKLG